MQRLVFAMSIAYYFNLLVILFLSPISFDVPRFPSHLPDSSEALSILFPLVTRLQLASLNPRTFSCIIIFTR